MTDEERKWIRVGVGKLGDRGGEPSTIRTTWLSALPRVHGWPSNLVVYQGSYPVDPVGCLIFRRASRLDAFSAYPDRTSATRRCRWHDNRYTGGPSIPVLSY